jgi:hypothetical protein
MNAPTTDADSTPIRKDGQKRPEISRGKEERILSLTATL